MNKTSADRAKDARGEYDFGAGERGKYAKRFGRGARVVLLTPALAKEFPTSESVLDAPRELLKQRRSPRAPTKR